MNKNIVIVLAGGFLIAILVAMIVQASLGGKPKKGEADTVQILVAAKALSAGTTLDETNVKWQDWPKTSVFPGTIVKEGGKKLSDVAKGQVGRAIAAGEPVPESAILKGGKDGSAVSASLKEGMRAVAIGVSANSMVGGFVGPGDYVDVLLTYSKKLKYEGVDDPNIENMVSANLGKYVTETILQNVRVIAVDQSAKRDAEKPVKLGKTITLEVDMRGAETLAVADKMGDLSLSLRRLGDDKIYVKNYPITTDERLTHITGEIYGQVIEMQKKSGQNANTVRVYNGFNVQQDAVGQ